MKFFLIVLISLLIMFRNREARRNFAETCQGFVELITGFSDETFLLGYEGRDVEAFTYYAGEPNGYTGFTDYNAMRSDLNNRVRNLYPLEQYWLVGFSAGFVQGVLDRCRSADAEDIDRELQLPDLETKPKAAINWLAQLQEDGTDNAPPSTRNLISGILATQQELAEQGPIRMDYWPKALRQSTERKYLRDILLKPIRIRIMAKAEQIGEAVAASLSRIEQ
tara:strand:+ start:515 stop:1180 length:666 start_codon:yes stop_codon:yes gene_type:complete